MMKIYNKKIERCKNALLKMKEESSLNEIKFL